MSLTVKIAGSTVVLQENTLKITSRVDDKDKAVFTVRDDTGTLAFTKGQTVSIVDSSLGTLFNGYLNKPTMINLFPNATNLWSMDCVDQFYVPAKRVHTRRHKGQHAAPIVALQVQKYLAPDGVSGNFGLDWSELQSEWASGTLSSAVSATNLTTGNVNAGNLELAPAGSSVSVVENTAAIFNTGTLNNTSAVNNTLQPTLVSALKLTAYQTQDILDGYVYFKIWSGSMVIGANDTFHYETWLPSTNASNLGGCVDILCTDGTIFGAQFDQLDIAAAVPNLIDNGVAIDYWYNRDVNIASLSGKTISSVKVAIYGSKQGNYQAYFKNIYLASQVGTPFFSKTATACNVNPPQQIQNAYMQNSLISIVQLPDKIANPVVAGATPAVYRISPSQSIDAGKILKSSAISWLQATQGKTSVAVSISYDAGASWLPCVNGAALPGMPPGSNIAGLSVQIREEFYTTDPDPTLIPSISALSWYILPSYVATKSDVIQSYVTGGSWAAGGTLTNTANTSGNLLTLNGVLRNWNDAVGTGQTLFGLASPAQFFTDTRFLLESTGTTNDARSEFTFAGQYADFTAEFDVLIDTVGIKYGCVYRTTGWSNTDGSFAYGLEVTTTTIELRRGTNGGANTTVTVGGLVTFSSALSAGWYRVKVVALGSSHKIYVNDVLYINATDATYTAQGYIGLRNRNTTAGPYSINFDNFGVMPTLSGTWLSNAISLTGASSYYSSIINWADGSTIPSQATELVEASLNGGSTWATCTNGGIIPGFIAGQSLSGINLTLRVTLTSTTATSLPGLYQLTARILGAYSSTGTRTNAPLAWDNMIRGNVAGGFGTATNSATYTKTGTGTVALTSNEALISNTTGDVHMSISGVAQQDTDATVRFSLSAAAPFVAGMELRYSNANSFYRLQASTTTISIVKAGGPVVTLATVAMALSTGTWYRMRFRVTGSGIAGSVSLQGSVWLDGASEPTTFTISASD